MWAVIIGFFAGFIRKFLVKKEQGEKAIETVIEDRNEALKSVEEANEIRNRVINDPDYADVVQQHFMRKDID